MNAKTKRAHERQDGLSARYVYELESLCDRFAKDYGGTLLTKITGQEIDDWLRGLKIQPSGVPVGARTRNNYRMALQTLFAFARRRGYLTDGWNEFNRVPKAKAPPSKIGIFTPEQLTTILSKAKPEMLPFLAIAAFAGVRAAEIQRLDWSEVGSEYITITKGKAKTSQRRLVPVLPALTAWLAPYRKPAGKVVPYKNVSNELFKLAKKAAVKWKQNALRHSFISYRLAIVQDVGKVALEAGNSTRVIFESYRELVTKNEAEKWFGILPA